MDEPLIDENGPYRIEGFANQRLCVVPRPQVEQALVWPATRRLTVTDAGYFPAARWHKRSRPNGADEVIVILCITGSGVVSLGEESYSLTPSSCVSIPAGTPHEYWSEPTDPWTIWWMHVRGTDVRELAGPLLGSAHPVRRLRALDRVVALFDEVVHHLESRVTPIHMIAASGVAWHLLTRLATDSILPADGSPLERAMRYLESRIDGTIRVDELATIVGLSASHLSALFRQATGGGPGAFHTALKMAKARELLDTTSLSITEVARAVGYSDPLYFSRHFRRVHDVNPSTYRAEHKG
ncbi:helix-turn-helix domain-containing protein [Microbacterium sp. NPDC056569]|uniref:helix-turn-helix domain-containing protein n=1 Tax=Microbacterium sp. NPDC056569 TaxID=3345867 RepID=UPI00366F16DA